jgi:hypothetical protein
MCNDLSADNQDDSEAQGDFRRGFEDSAASHPLDPHLGNVPSRVVEHEFVNFVAQQKPEQRIFRGPTATCGQSTVGLLRR